MLHAAVSPEEAKIELSAVLASTVFTRSPRLSRLLSYLCTTYLAGDGDRINEYRIGVEALDRPESFDPSNDAAARVEVHRLRRRLQQFYETEGINRRIRILIPVGHYVPAFVTKDTEDAAHIHVPEIRAAEAVPEVAAPQSAIPTKSETEDPPAIRRPHRRIPWTAVGLLAIATAMVAPVLILKVVHRTSSAETIEAPLPLAETQPATAVPVAILPGDTVRLACGRIVRYTDRSGQVWSADRYFEGGTSFDSPRQLIRRAADSKLFQSGRTGEFSYSIPLSKGVYELHLGFAETTFGPELNAGGGEYSRTFDVKANGRTLLDDFDVYSDARGDFIADVRVFKDMAPGDDGLLHLSFHGRRAAAMVNYIEIVPARPHRLNPVRLVTQENFLTLANGTVWHPDEFFMGGQLSNHAVPVTGTDDPDLFARERFGHFDYAVPADTGTYTLSLYFAEEYFGPENAGGGGVGSRVFDVFCNGAYLLRSFDVFKEARNRALVKTFHGLVPNALGKIEISFVPVRNYPSLYALELVDESQ